MPLVGNLRPLIVVDSVTSLSRSIRCRRTVVSNISSAYLALGWNLRRIKDAEDRNDNVYNKKMVRSIRR
jgi:hypothetical protein